MTHSNAFFRALGHRFQKQAERIPWALLLEQLRNRRLIPEALPPIPLVETRLLADDAEQKEIPTPEQQPELLSEDEAERLVIPVPAPAVPALED